MIINILPTNICDDWVSDICCLLLRYGMLIFSEYQNPISVFFNEWESNKLQVVSLFGDNVFLGFVVLHNFHKVSAKKFSCYIYGAAKRKNADIVEQALNFVFCDLKEKGCVAVRFETYKFNMPMRFLANRLGFRKVGVLEMSNFINGKYVENILYEKIL